MNKIIIFVLFLVFTLPTTFAAHAEEEQLTFIGVTNLIHDKFFKVSKSFMAENALKTDGTYLIDADEANRLVTLAQNAEYQEVHHGAGGSAGNTIVTLRNLGLGVGLMGTLAYDDLATLYLANLTEKGIHCRLAPPQNDSLKSASCIIFVSENDGGGLDRAMYTDLGVSGDIRLSAENIIEAAKARCFLAEGYSFNMSSPNTIETYRSVCAIAEKAIENHNLVALTLSADFCVTYFAEQINSFIENYASIVIGNESEATILTKTSTPLDAVKDFRKKGKKGAVTRGSKGAYVFDETGIYEIKSPYVEVVLDPTGAGDAFAGGFLHGLLEGKNISEAGQIGALCAGEVIKVWGGHTPAYLAETVSSNAAASIQFEKIED